MKRVYFLLAILLSGGASFAPASAQVPQPDTAWNGERALELIGRAQDRRSAANADSGLSSYRADARIHVYFYLDRPDTRERNLVKTDQLALEVYWEAPDRTKQRIVGWRDEKSLPTNINYHLDHLTVVQENFGDEIRLGDGDEVMNVVHPAARGAENYYEYRLADSLTLRLPGADEPVRVYELQVRPLDVRSPGFVGSVFVERRAGDIVRMDFTFTPASYVDRYLDYINISLDNGLWGGRFWLPNEQRVEIRRRIPEFDIPAGSIIRANMRVGGYVFDEPMPIGFFSGSNVVALPRAEREAFPFEEDIHARVREEGLGPDSELGIIREMAAELMRDQAFTRSRVLRFRARSFSELLRYNRAEGLVTTLGMGAEPLPGLRASLRGGWAWGAEHPVGSADFAASAGSAAVDANLYVNETPDAGPEIASGALNTLASLLAGEDYTDPYHVTGGRLTVGIPIAGGWRALIGARAERQRSAKLTSDYSVVGELRPVVPIDATDLMLGGHLALQRASSAESGRQVAVLLAADFGHLDPRAGSPAEEAGAALLFLRPRWTLEARRRWLPGDAAFTLRAEGGFAVGELPIQALYRAGGRGTLPGYPLRAFAGDRTLAARVGFARDLHAPWLRGRIFGAAGWTEVGSAGREAMERAGLRPTGTIRPSIGAGVGLLHDILRIDVARGLGEGGRWELIVDANPGFWDFL